MYIISFRQMTLPPVSCLILPAANMPVSSQSVSTDQLPRIRIGSTGCAGPTLIPVMRKGSTSTFLSTDLSKKPKQAMYELNVVVKAECYIQALRAYAACRFNKYSAHPASPWVEKLCVINASFIASLALDGTCVLPYLRFLIMH
ncbi:hypothetical protein F5146DRAFT_762699 [Armillaria mellea]|nr:hypothetical protein F5146DRAFT_762699 [Armillaria mellea]